MSRSVSTSNISDLQVCQNYNSVLERIWKLVASSPELIQSCDLFTFYHFLKRNNLYFSLGNSRDVKKCKHVQHPTSNILDLQVRQNYNSVLEGFESRLPPSSSKVGTSLLSTIFKNEIVCILDSASHDCKAGLYIRVNCELLMYMSPDEIIDMQRAEIARLQYIVDHQAKRINDVAFRYKAMFGMDALFRQVFPERVPSSGMQKNGTGCSVQIKDFKKQ